MATHTVTNQPPPREGIEEYAANVPLVEAVRRHGADWAEPELTASGQLVGAAALQQDAALANIHEPALHAFDRYGAR